jgi:hypothetical protein
MAFSSVSVVSNALLLRRWRPAALPLLPDFDVAEAHRPVPAIGVSPFLTGGLERPPRSALA